MTESCAAPVKGPCAAEEGFVHDFLEHANRHADEILWPGDVLSLPEVSVKYGNVRSAVVDAPVPGTAGGDAATLLRVRIRARIRPPPPGSGEELPAGYVLVKGVEPRDEPPAGVFATEWRAVQAAAVASDATLMDGESLREFFVYSLQMGWDGTRMLYLRDSLPLGAVFLDFDELSRHRSDLLSHSPSGDEIWNRHQRVVDDLEGAVFRDGGAPDDLVKRLREEIDRFAASQGEPDYHPNTGRVVLDIVHPSLYPFVAGVSHVAGGESAAANAAENEHQPRPVKADRWGREWTTSRFAWLPANVRTGDNGSVKFLTYINNLPMTAENALLYGALEELFALCLPMFEGVYSYLSAVRFHEDSADLEDNVDLYKPDLAAASLRGRELKVVTKIVEYQLRPGDTFSGVWHVEGMSHESIVMTGLYILDRDDGFGGGDLLFKRAFLDYEASAIYFEVPQSRCLYTDKLVADGLRPLGTLRTPEGRMIVFPNSHVHRLSEMYRSESGGAAEGGTRPSGERQLRRRRIIVFWIVDPERQEMVTTRGVAPQQKTMSREDALRYRLELMEERKRHKQDFNVREIELCEH